MRYYCFLLSKDPWQTCIMDNDEILKTDLISAMDRSFRKVAPWATQTAINKAVEASSEAALPVLRQEQVATPCNA